MPLVAAFTALVTSLSNYKRMGSFISIYTPLSSPHAYFIVYLFIAIFILFLFQLGIKLLVGKVIREQVSTLYDSIFGLIFGILRGILIITLVVTALSIAPTAYVRNSVKNKSITAEKFLKVGPLIRKRTMSVLGRG